MSEKINGDNQRNISKDQDDSTSSGCLFFDVDALSYIQAAIVEIECDEKNDYVIDPDHPIVKAGPQLHGPKEYK